MEKSAILIHPKDTVAVLLKPLVKGNTTIGLPVEIQASEDIPAGHKVAIHPIAQGEVVIKYGAPIGYATQPIAVGQHVHTHNVRTGLSDQLTYAYQPDVHPLQPLLGAAFRGFRRKDGRAGVRNDIWIIPTVGCVNGIAQRIAEISRPFLKGSVGKVLAFPHPYGCSQMGEDQDATRTILADLCMHPNAGGILLLGLGCENSGVEDVKAFMPGFDERHVRTLVCQEHEDEIAESVVIVKELIEQAACYEREAIPAKELVVGLKCGGSDGLSGITANPVIGGFSDLLIAHGGATILTEVPEMFGAETLLMARCESKGVFDKTTRLINDFKQYYEDHHQTIYENPSPGNKAGGITTLEDKALGCTQKSGTAPVSDVLAYGERVVKPGLNLLSAPGNDLVAATALAASGAHMVLFSTGRGTPFGCPVPTVKISSNTSLAEHKKTWIDFNAGLAVEGSSIDAMADDLFSYVLAVASGEQLKHENAAIYDIAIFKQGVTL